MWCADDDGDCISIDSSKQLVWIFCIISEANPEYDLENLDTWFVNALVDTKFNSAPAVSPSIFITFSTLVHANVCSISTPALTNFISTSSCPMIGSCVTRAELSAITNFPVKYISSIASNIERDITRSLTSTRATLVTICTSKFL